MRKNKRSEKIDISILALDDDPLMTSTIQSYFERSGYQVDAVNDPWAAIEQVRQNHYDILLLDFLMTPICGDQVVAEIRQFDRDIFIILLTGHKSMAPPIRTIRQLDIQGYYEKSDRFDQLELLVESCVKSIRQMRTIRSYQQELTQAYQTLGDSYMEMIKAIRLMVDAKDTYTRGHSDRVSYLSHRLAQEMGKDEAFCERVRMAGLFHDIGKMAIPDRILLKTGPLTDEEYAVIQRHPEEGARILSAVSLFRDLAPAVRAHHERLDGKGYPHGLSGIEIPLEARIIAVADAFDAMLSDRQYRKGMPLPAVVQEIQREKGHQFDPAVADVLLRIIQNEGPEKVEEFMHR